MTWRAGACWRSPFGFKYWLKSQGFSGVPGKFIFTTTESPTLRYVSWVVKFPVVLAVKHRKKEREKLFLIFDWWRVIERIAMTFTKFEPRHASLLLSTCISGFFTQTFSGFHWKQSFVVCTQSPEIVWPFCQEKQQKMKRLLCKKILNGNVFDLVFVSKNKSRADRLSSFLYLTIDIMLHCACSSTCLIAYPQHCYS